MTRGRALRYAATFVVGLLIGSVGLSLADRADGAEATDLLEADGGLSVALPTGAFVQAATADGFTAAERQVMIDSGLYARYPVTVRVGKVATTAAAKPGGAVGVWCRSANANSYFVEGVSVVGLVVYRFELGEGYCWRNRRGDNNNSIISWDRQPTVSHSVPVWAQADGWTWEGMDDSGAFGPRFYEWMNQGPESALKTWRQGHMKFCPIHIPVGCQGRFPWIHIYNHADGTNHVSGGVTS